MSRTSQLDRRNLNPPRHRSDSGESNMKAITVFGQTARHPITLLAIACMMLVSNAWAQSAPTPDISGFWELRYYSRNIPQASLTPAAAGADKDAQAAHDFHVIRWCNHVGVPFMMDDGSPIDIRQGKNEIAIASQSNSPVRHIYTDGRQHPSHDTFDPTTLGNSIGRWNGDTLVVDTIGFNDAGLSSIPGGGVRNENSQLVEQFRLTDEGRKLMVTFTWIDDKVFSKPHAYAFLYEKLPPDTTAREWLCDPMDGARARFLIDPPQPPK